jgi:ribose transport system ATP-binding protein
MAGNTPRLQVRGLSKTFRNTQVLHEVEFTVSPGEVHGLAGQNGSGKSTLIKILTGYHAPDPGTTYIIDGIEMRLPARWRDAHAAGISVVHQDLGLLDTLSVAENICVGGYPTSRVPGRIDPHARDLLAARTLARLGVDIHPRLPVAALSAAERAEVAIARAMRDHATGAGLIILDESTRALGGDDLRRIHALLRRVAAAGSAVLFVSHNLTEIVKITDRLTILRDGRAVGSGLTTKDLDEQKIASLMLGSSLAASPERAQATRRPPEPAIRVRNLTGPRLHAVDLQVGPGEVLGITGLPGSGYEDIPYLLTGAQRADTGTAEIGRTTIDLRKATVASCIRAGMVLVPERRDRDGLAFEQSIRDNIALPALRHRGKSWFVARQWQQKQAEEATATLGIRPDTPSMLVKELSGGNQQKVLLAKWLGMAPKLLVLHEPTQAVDVRARQDILAAVARTAGAGAAVLLVSSIPDDLAVACDRVLIHRAEQGLREADGITSEQLVEQVYGSSEADERSTA